MDIQSVLEEAPQKIYAYATEEIRFYEEMIRMHEEYKFFRAKKYLEAKVKGSSIKDVEYSLDNEPALIELKNKEITAEINYKKQKALKDRADDYLQVALEMGRSQRAEIRAGLDVITNKEDS